MLSHHRFVLLTKSERFDALASLMGFVPQMEYLKGLRRTAEKLKADLDAQRVIFKDAQRRHDEHFSDAGPEKLSPLQLLARRFVGHEIPFDGTVTELADAAAMLKQLVVADKSSKRLAVQRDAKHAISSFMPPAGIDSKIRALRAALGDLKASQAADREKMLRIPLLQSAKEFLEKVTASGRCPLCSVSFKGDLKDHVATELAALQRLEQLLSRVRSAKESVRIALIDQPPDTPVNLPPKYTPVANEVASLESFQAKVKNWKAALARTRDLLAFDTSALDDALLLSFVGSGGLRVAAVAP